MTHDQTRPSKDSPTGPDQPCVRPVGRKRGGWYMAQGHEHYILTRHWPPQFDVSAEALFPALDPARLARQIRQDLWRRLRDLRGFSPVVQISITRRGLRVRAGGRVAARTVPRQHISERIAALLADPTHRARWQAWARIKAAA